MKLIDKDLIYYTCKYNYDCEGINCDKCTDHCADSISIDKLPIINLVYCKDCKHYTEFEDSISSKKVKGCMLHFIQKDENGFCDEAERRLS